MISETFTNKFYKHYNDRDLASAEVSDHDEIVAYELSDPAHYLDASADGILIPVLPPKAQSPLGAQAAMVTTISEFPFSLFFYQMRHTLTVLHIEKLLSTYERFTTAQDLAGQAAQYRETHSDDASFS